MLPDLMTRNEPSLQEAMSWSKRLLASGTILDSSGPASCSIRT
jgi:hypothetical protein